MTLHRQWLERLPSQGVLVSPAALAEADAYPTEPVDALRAALAAATGADGSLLRPDVLLTDPAALGWPEEHWMAIGAPEADALRRSLAFTGAQGALRVLGVLHEQDRETRANERSPALVAVAAATSVDLDADVRDGASLSRDATTLGRALRAPLVVLFSPREIRLIHAPQTGPSAWLSFPVAQLQVEDGDENLGALHMLIGVRRLLSLPEEKRLPALLTASRATAIHTLALHEFTVFSRAELALSPGINVLIGPNGSGKTHAMKALYALLRVLAEEESPEARGARAARKLASVFLPEGADLGRLVRWGKGRARISVTPERGTTAELVLPSQGEPEMTGAEIWHGPARSLYLPTREVLAPFETLISAYVTREIGFDETIYDACVALQTPLLRHLPEAFSAVRARLERIAGGPVHLRGSRFYVERDERLVEAQLLADGIRKVAALAQLVANGSIAPFGTLLWDEPEGNLNPTLVVQVADLLVDLAAQGVQVIVASHDYLFVRRLSLISEYKKSPNAPIRFFGLCPTDKGVEIETGDTLAELAHNPILDEFTRQADFEQQLFYETPG